MLEVIEFIEDRGRISSGKETEVSGMVERGWRVKKVSSW